MGQYDRYANVRPHLSKSNGEGVHTLSKKRPILSGWGDKGVNAITGQRPNLRPAQGVNGLSQRIPMIGTRPGSGGVHTVGLEGIYGYMQALQERLRRVRVVCGDWGRIMGPSVTYKIGMTGIFLDPPYHADAGRAEGLYAVDDLQVSAQVREWCLAEMDEKVKGRVVWSGPRYRHPKLRIALCGYEDEHGPFMPDDWEMVAWKTNGGYGNQNSQGNVNGGKERIWFSPNCLRQKEDILAGVVDETDYSDLFGV